MFFKGPVRSLCIGSTTYKRERTYLITIIRMIYLPTFAILSFEPLDPRVYKMYAYNNTRNERTTHWMTSTTGIIIKTLAMFAGHAHSRLRQKSKTNHRNTAVQTKSTTRDRAQVIAAGPGAIAATASISRHVRQEHFGACPTAPSCCSSPVPP